MRAVLLLLLLLLFMLCIMLIIAIAVLLLVWLLVMCELLQLLATGEAELIHVECCSLGNLAAGASSCCASSTPFLGGLA